jgi:hypothetical protein
MNQATMGFLMIGWKLVLALVAGSSILTTIGVFLLARFTTVLDAHAGERAKLIAQFHNLDKLVTQTEKLTATTETIKAEIQHKVWETQTTLTLKRDIYTRLLEAIGEMIEDQQESKFLEAMHRTKFATMPELVDKHRDSEARLEKTMQKWNRAIDVAPIPISDQAYALLPKVFLGLIQVNFGGPSFSVECDRNIEHLKMCRYQLQQAARADFGMSTLALEKPL